MSDQSTTNIVDSSPDPTTQTLVYTLIRSVLMIMGTFGFTWGAGISQQAWMVVAGAIATLIGVIWAFVQKFKAARANHAGSVASAASGVAVQVTSNV